MPSHYHDEACLVLVRSGSVSHTQGPHQTLLGPKSVLYLPPAERHADGFGSDGASCIVIKMDSRWIADRLGCEDGAGLPMTTTDHQAYALGAAVHAEARQPDDCSTLIVEGSLLQLLGRWKRKRTRTAIGIPRWLALVEAILRESFHAPPSLRDVAHAAGVHPSRVAREFHRVYGTTTGEYLRRLRVSYVTERLTTTQHRRRDTLADVALAAGFSSHAHMTVVFRRITGFTPSQWRKMHSP